MSAKGVGAMWALLGLLASTNTSLAQVAINTDVAKEANFRVPVSDSVRAATWDMMTFKPAHAITVRVACIVMVPHGTPGACVSASRLTSGQTVADWRKLREEEDADQSRSPTDVELLGIVTARLGAARLPAKRDAKDMFAIQLFEETISPADARPAFVPGEALTLSEVTLAAPLDSNLVQALFPGDEHWNLSAIFGFEEHLAYFVLGRIEWHLRLKEDIFLACYGIEAVQRRRLNERLEPVEGVTVGCAPFHLCS